jgi:hypothetical protein
MGHLYYTELGNTAWNFTNEGPFIGFKGISYFFWTKTEYASNPTGYAWGFNFTSSASQSYATKGNTWYTLAVRDGDVPASAVPEPATLLLVGSGLAGFIVSRKKKKASQVVGDLMSVTGSFFR